MNAIDVLTAIMFVRDKGEDPSMILAEDSPIMDAARDVLMSSAHPKRPCTCHPDDNPPVPCVQQYALSECLSAHELRQRLDALGVAIADAGYTWTEAMRSAYEGTKGKR